uniref:Scavenger receptor class B member 1 n=2 Tax=Culex pipiens TaxID=7175 RepID=A0A8D8BL22_CULPI
MRGLIDVTECYYGFPIALSYPHFHDGDPRLISQVDGLSPNKTLHSSYFMINALSGLPLKLSVKFQINMAMGEIGGVVSCDRFSNIVLPALWFEITMYKLPTSLRNRFLLYLHYLQIFDRLLRYGLLVCGGLLLIFPVVRATFMISNLFVPSYDISRNLHPYTETCKNPNRKRSILKKKSSEREKGTICEKEQFLA